MKNCKSLWLSVPRGQPKKTGCPPCGSKVGVVGLLRASIIFASLCPIFVLAEPHYLSLTKQDTKAQFQEININNETASYVVDIGKNTRIDTVLEITPKGNGTIGIANLVLHVWDTHDNGLVYKGKCLDVDGVDVNGDGWHDIIVSGTAIHTGEKEWDNKEYESIVFIYLYDGKQGQFKEIYKKSSFEINLGKTN
ncbi:MAG: hypothetical protein HY272_00320 [Gammaproteobacteria bacterium]|nr:hypothetical protein [Gammaproteobacteria bacterium]